MGERERRDRRVDSSVRLPLANEVATRRALDHIYEAAVTELRGTREARMI